MVNKRTNQINMPRLDAYVFSKGTRYASNAQGLTTGGDSLRRGSGGTISRAWLQQLAISTDRKISKHVSYYGANPTNERRGSAAANGERADARGTVERGSTNCYR